MIKNGPESGPSRLLPRSPARRPRPLEIIPPQPAGHIHHLTHEIKPLHPARHHGPPVQRAGVHPPPRHLRRAIALGPRRHQPPIPQQPRHPVQRGSRNLGQGGCDPRHRLQMPRQLVRHDPPQRGPHHGPPLLFLRAPQHPPPPPPPLPLPPDRPPPAQIAENLPHRRPRQPARGEQRRLVKASPPASHPRLQRRPRQRHHPL